MLTFSDYFKLEGEGEEFPLSNICFFTTFKTLFAHDMLPTNI